MLEYYKQPKREAKTLQLGKNTEVRIDEMIIKDLLVKIYEDPSAGLRELFANSINACKTAKEKYGANPSIEVVINPANMKLEIIEHDSLGMTIKMFEEVYTVLGRSGNFDGEKPGQFGVGMAAYFALSDNMLVETFARDGTRFVKFGHGLDGFEDVTAHNKQTLEKHGSRFTLTLRMKKTDEDTRRDVLNSLITRLQECACFAGIPTVLTMLTSLKGLNFDVGKHEIGPITPEEFYQKKPIFIIDNEDYRLDIGWYNKANHESMTTLAGMPINSKLELPFTYVLQIKNERKYKPTASRDSLTDEAVIKIKNKIYGDMINVIELKIGYNAINWVNEPYLVMLLHKINQAISNLDTDVIAEKSPKLRELVDAMSNNSVIHLKHGRTEARISSMQSPIAFIHNSIRFPDAKINEYLLDAVSNKRVRCMVRSSMEAVNDYLTSSENLNILIVPKGDKLEKENIVNILNKAGIPKLNLKAPTRNNSGTSVSHYVHGKKDKTERKIYMDGVICINKIGKIKDVIKLMMENEIEDVEVYNGDEKLGCSIDEHYHIWAGKEFNDIEENKIHGKNILSNPEKYLLVNNNHTLAKQINYSTYEKMIDENASMPIIIITETINIANLQAASLFMNDIVLKTLNEDARLFETFARKIHGINEENNAYVEYLPLITDLLKRVHEKEVKKAIISSINESGQAEKLAKVLSTSLYDYDGIIDAYVQLCIHIEKSKLKIYPKRNFIREMGYLFRDSIDYNELECGRILKKHYFPHADNVKIWRETYATKIMIETGSNMITKSITRRILNRMNRQTRLPSTFASLRMSTDGKKACLFLEDE